MPTLAEAFAALPLPVQERPEAIVFSAAPAVGCPTHRIARQLSGSPALLLRVDASAEPRPAPVELENLQVQHDLECAISKPDGGRETGRFSVVRCKGSSRELHAYFLRIADAILQVVGPRPTRAQVAAAIDRLVELFSAMSLPSKKSVQGLWAEVYLIARSEAPDAMIRAWHSTPEDRYDFGEGGRRIEVKSCGGPPRRHHFTLEQLTPPRGAKAIVASLFVQRTGSGVSIADLIERIGSEVPDSDLILRLETVVAATLGDCWPNGLRDHFDEETANESLSYYDSVSVPTIGGSVPAELSQVRFVSDLSSVTPQAVEAMRREGGIFAAVA